MDMALGNLNLVQATLALRRSGTNTCSKLEEGGGVRSKLGRIVTVWGDPLNTTVAKMKVSCSTVNSGQISV